MPPKRKSSAGAQQKATGKVVEETTPRRSSRSASAVASAAVSAAGSKRKASPSPSPVAGRGASAKKGRTQSPSPASASRGRSAAAKKAETPDKSSETAKGKGRITRNVVQEVEEKKSAQPKGRSSSRSAKAPSTPKKASPKARAPTPKKAETPKQKAATPKQKAVTPKKKESPKKAAKKDVTPKQKASKPQPKKSPEQKPKQEKKSPQKAKTPASPAPKPSRSRRGRQEKTESDEDKSEKKVEAESDVKDLEKSEENAEKAEACEEAKESVEESEGVEQMDVEDSAAVEPETEDKPEDEEHGEKEDDNVEQDQEGEAPAAEADKAVDTEKVEKSEEAENVSENVQQLESGVSDEKIVEAATKEAEQEATEDAVESEQVESDEKECESAESEQVQSVETPQVEAESKSDNVIDIKDDSGDGVEVISDSSEKPQDNVIDLNEDSGEAVVVEEEPAVVQGTEDTGNGSGDNSANAKTSNEVEVISDDDDDDVKEINGQVTTADGDKAQHLSQNESIDSGKRKIDDVVEADDVEETKKSRTEEQNVENGEAENEIEKDYVVVEMGDVPSADSEEITKSLPNTVTSSANSSVEANSVNPVFNRTFIPNPAFAPSSDTTKQFSLVTYNMLADCHLRRNDYSFTESKYLNSEYRLAKVIEELKYLEGDIVCLQEVDPDFYSKQLHPAMQGLGYEGFYKKRTQDFYQEGEATFYKLSKFALVDSSLCSLAELVNKQETEGIDPTTKAAVQKYLDLADVVVVTKFRSHATGQEVTVGNVHIVWGEMKTPDAQCVQIASAVKEIVSKAGGDNFPHIICGDFNSPPMTPGYLVASDGYPSGDEVITKLMDIKRLELPDGKRLSLVDAVWPAFQHTSSSLRSAYKEAQGKEPDVTSYNGVMCECVDYIFYSSSSLDNVGVWATPGKERILATGGTPNVDFPSDHLSLKACLAFK